MLVALLAPSSRRCRYCCRCRFFRHTNASVSLVGELGKVIPFIFSTVSFEKEEYQSAGESCFFQFLLRWVESIFGDGNASNVRLAAQLQVGGCHSFGYDLRVGG